MTRNWSTRPLAIIGNLVKFDGTQAKTSSKMRILRKFWGSKKEKPLLETWLTYRLNTHFQIKHGRLSKVQTKKKQTKGGLRSSIRKVDVYWKFQNLVMNYQFKVICSGIFALGFRVSEQVFGMWFS